tara:strand:+ start:1741 stop:1890 length:150 start_codon:yes stop_codon:yes gene_type:complete
LNLDYLLVKKVLDYRTAQATVEQFNEDASKMTPEMVKMMKILNKNMENE